MSEPETKDAAKSPSWQDWVTRTTAILAVLAALSSGRTGATNLNAILEQGKVNDAWAYYQAKSIKEHGAEQARELAKALAADAGSKSTALEAFVKAMGDEAERESAAKDKQLNEAKALEERRNKLVENSFWFEISFAFLQLGVILCTIATGAKKRAPWYAGIVLGLLGLLLIVNGFEQTRFFNAPDFLYKSKANELGYTPPPKK
jgi:hypothetical protein